MIKRCVLTSFFCIFLLNAGDSSGWKPEITDKELDITPHYWETCYQYAERKVNEMKKKYSDRRIVGSEWLSAYWAYHYEGALEQRNYFWLPV